MSSSAAKVFIQVETEAEQQEHLKTQRRTLKPIQATVDKENLTGRQTQLDQLSRLKQATVGNSIVLATPEYGKRKRLEPSTAAVSTIKTSDAQSQTDETIEANADPNKAITIEDLTSAIEPGEHYYKRLAEKRREALEQTLSENQRLSERIEGLEEELDTARKELMEAHNLVSVLKEIIAETEAEQTNEAKEADAQEPLSDVESEASTSAAE